MNRQRLAQMHISLLHIQQGLFASLALLVMLIGGQQFQRWGQSQQEMALRLPPHYTNQMHFSALSSQFTDSAPVHLMGVDQAQAAVESIPQERWVF